MPRRKSLSDIGVANLKPRQERYAEPDPELRGHYIRVQPSGAKSFVAVARNPAGKQVWATIGPTNILNIEQARDRARDAIQRIRDGLPAFEERANADTFGEVAQKYLARHVRANALRSQSEIERCLTKYVLPAWVDREFTAVRRSDVAELLDAVQDHHGSRQADYVLAIARGICNWYAARNDDYRSPITRGMRRTDPKSRKRARILDDDELRAIWRAAEDSGTFGAIIRLALLTAQRRAKILTMRWADVSVDGEWRIPAEDREKGTAGSLVLPGVAVEIIRAQPRIGDNPYVFAGREEGHFNGVSKAKRAFDAKLPAMPPWVIHDLRRTARSLMARAGVRPDIAQRVMGHAIAGLEGVYDRHSYRDEKADALARLSALVDAIVNPPAGNVLRLRMEH
jgi:integrase